MLVDKDGKIEHSKNESKTEEPGFPGIPAKDKQ